nr:uncharacterized protein LOC117217754 [Megalopta genalis]
MPSYTRLINFLRKRANCSSNSVAKPNANPVNRHIPPTIHTKGTTARIPRIQTYLTTTPQCAICNSPHTVRECETFIQASPTTRYKTVTTKSLCHNCLRSGHPTQPCKSSFNCRICNQRHHTLLHQQRDPDNRHLNTSSSSPTCEKTTPVTPRQETSEHERSSISP